MRMEDQAFALTEWTVVDTQTAATATATKSGVAGKTHYITGITVSADRAPTAGARFDVKDSTPTTLDSAQVPNAAFAPIMKNYTRPLRCASGKDATITIPSLGASVVCTITIQGYTRT